jgi:transcriptional regulator with XRE-family HTH domain
LAKRVRELRSRRGLTQEAFATRSGISVSFVSLLERGVRTPSYETLLRIAQALEVPVAELFVRVEAEGQAIQRIADYARVRKLSLEQVERLIAVADAMFMEPAATGT